MCSMPTSVLMTWTPQDCLVGMEKGRFPVSPTRTVIFPAYIPYIPLSLGSFLDFSLALVVTRNLSPPQSDPLNTLRYLTGYFVEQIANFIY